jgi:hypothetical protein
LSNDLEWKPIGDMRVGDIIMGIDEYKTEGNSQRRVRDAIILSKMEVVRDAYRVEMSDGTYVDCTKDHKFLMPQHRSMRRSNRNYEWKELGNIRFHGKTINPIKKLNYPDYSHIIMRVISPELCVTNNSYSAGYLAGFMDADGSLTATYKKQFMASFTQSTKHPHLIDGIEKHLRLLDIPYSVDLSYQHNGSFGENQHPMAHIRLNGGYYKTLEGLCKIKPEKAKGFSFDRMGAPWRGKEFVSIENIYPIGKREISIVSTSCGTYNTNGYFSHNCNGYKEGNHVAGFLHMCEDMGFEKASRVAVAAMQDGAHTFEELEDIEDGCLSAIEIMENYYAENSSII